MKISRRLASAIALFFISALMITSTTYAWFSINSEVKMTGMQVTATAGDNVMVYKTPSQVQGEDELFHNAVVLPHREVKLAPASSADGKAFYYVEGRNVNGAGDIVKPMAYIPYDAGSSDSVNAFNKNYRTTGSVAYTEYIFQLKATNAQDRAQELVMSALDLTYGGTTAGTQKAFRVAIFVDEFPEDPDPEDASLPEVSTETLVSILGPEGAVYRTNRTESGRVLGQTVGTDAHGELEMHDVSRFGESAVLGTVPSGKTYYYRVIVRLWLEGEDTTCGNATFAPLGDAWALDLSIAFGTDIVKAVEHLNDTSATGETVIYTDGQNGYTVDAAHPTEVDHVLYYPILKDGAPISFGVRESLPVSLFVTEKTLRADSAIYALAYDATYGIYRYPTDVTNRVTVRVASVDLRAATAASTDTVTAGDPAVVYYPIVGKTLGGEQLYAAASGALSGTSRVYTVSGNVATDVSESCILPPAP